mmetsp:Transcript_144902/g.251448  ORF Transcript_144902/g.251448 Transcript_144902/m.251448 type:complete len:231 (+) Transcript_144902:63-755(+)
MAHAAAAVSGARLSRKRHTHRSSGFTSEREQARLRDKLEAEKQRRLHFAEDNPQGFLESLGFGKGTPPATAKQLSIEMRGHSEKSGYTYYQIMCTMKGPADKGPLGQPTWHCEKRLCEIREDLFDMVYEALGDEGYNAMFFQTPFALRGGLPGTTARLTGWFETVATCINTAKLDPRICGLVLHHLDAPIPDETEDFDSAPVHQVSSASLAEPAPEPLHVAPPQQVQMAC